MPGLEEVDVKEVKHEEDLEAVLEKAAEYFSSPDSYTLKVVDSCTMLLNLDMLASVRKNPLHCHT